MDFERCAGNITAGKKQCLNQDSHPESLPDRASTNLAEQLKPDISTDILTPVNVSNKNKTYIFIKRCLNYFECFATRHFAWHFKKFIHFFVWIISYSW